MLKLLQSKKILALSPMDGVTDSPMRQITKKYGQPDLMWTEFTNVEGLHWAKKKLRSNFIFQPHEQPLIAQIYGQNPEFFYEATQEICALGFAGIDLNFACPARTVLRSGGGGTIITKPELAQEIIQAVQQAARDYAQQYQQEILPVGVKTRLGYEQIELHSWLTLLLSMQLDYLTIHGRTVKQAYAGEADWQAITQIVKMRDKIAPTTLIFGNGDITSYEQAQKQIKQSGVDGILIGRGAIGNPWVFSPHQPTLKEKIQVAIEHCQLYEQTYAHQPRYSFAGMKKHLSAYINNFPQAKSWRLQLMQVHSATEAMQILKRLL